MLAARPATRRLATAVNAAALAASPRRRFASPGLLQLHVRLPPAAAVRPSQRHTTCGPGRGTAVRCFSSASRGGLRNRAFYASVNRRSAFAAGRYDAPPSRQFILTPSGPDALTQHAVLQALTHQDAQSALFSAQQEASLVILASPEYAAWFDSEGQFVSKVLAAACSEQIERDVIVLCAVVDGLPTQDGSSTNGLAFMFDWPEALPDLMWVTDKPKPEEQLKESSLTFSVFKDTYGASWDITVPLANTLFSNGRLSTLLASNWIKDPSSGSFKPVLKPFQTATQTIAIHPSLASSWPSATIPATPLTVPRRIEAALGNIVRKVAGKDGKPVPASHELEGIVEDYFVATQQPRQPVSVWALVVPEALSEDLLAGTGPDGATMTQEAGVRSSWVDARHQSRWIAHWVKHGARLHKVLSGGGGWGQKTGLLSLDPETSYAPTDVEEASFTAPLDSIDLFAGRAEHTDADSPLLYDDLVRASPLGRVATPGAYLQFFIDPLLRDTTAPAPAPCVADAARSSPTAPALLLGTIAPTTDAMPAPPSTSTAEDVDRVAVIDDAFGALTQTALFVAEPYPELDADDKHVAASKVSFPRSRVSWAR